MHCEQCRRPLQHAHEICQACNRELSYPASSNSNKALGVGRHRCPACNGFFDHWTTTLLPRNARWYTPQERAITCPLCKEVLQWKRDAEPEQLPAGFQGIAFGVMWGIAYTIPPYVRLWATEQLGKWSLLLIPLLLIGMFFVAVRPSVQGVGIGPGHFMLAQAQPERKAKVWAGLLSGTAVFVGHWAVTQDIWLSMWCAWFGLGASGCVAAVLWRHFAERRKHLQPQAIQPHSLSASCSTSPRCSSHQQPTSRSGPV